MAVVAELGSDVAEKGSVVAELGSDVAELVSVVEEIEEIYFIYILLYLSFCRRGFPI